MNFKYIRVVFSFLIFTFSVKMRPGGESNPRIRVLQTLVLPLDYQAIIKIKLGLIRFRPTTFD